MTKLKLEAGKYYLTRDGRKVGPMVASGETGYFTSHYIDGVWQAFRPFFFINGNNIGGYDEFRADDLIAEWTDTPTIGTLAEIGAQVGDVVTADGYGRALTVEAIDQCRSSPYVLRDVDGDLGWYAGTFDKWRIVSRASDAKSPVELSVDLGEAIKQVVAESQSSPVQLRKVIVPGVYGRVNVEDVAERIGIMIDDYFDRNDLTEAIATLTAIRDAL